MRSKREWGAKNKLINQVIKFAFKIVPPSYEPFNGGNLETKTGWGMVEGEKIVCCQKVG